MNTQEPADKQEIILQAAHRRLGVYGFEKTTMNEIARDIGMSKAALYYYYPDKEAIFKAVISRDMNEYFVRVDQIIASQQPADQMILEYVSHRIKYLKIFMNMSKLRSVILEEIKPLLKEILLDFKVKEVGKLAQIIEKGNQSALFNSENPPQDAQLLLDVMKGLRFSLVHQKTFVELSDEEISMLDENFIRFTKFYIKGLKYK
jgi:Transcriptional regulator